ncbi:MAG: hypothetical protein AAGF97_00395 [Planctomycetota bacterium]
MKDLLQELPSTPTLLASVAAVTLLVMIDLEKPSPQTPHGQQAMWRRLPDVQHAPEATHAQAPQNHQAWRPAPVVTPPSPPRTPQVRSTPTRVYDSVSARLQLQPLPPTTPPAAGRLSMNAARDRERWPYSAPAFDGYSL